MTGRFLWTEFDGTVMYPISATINNITLDTSLVVRSDVDMCHTDTDMLQSKLMFDGVSFSDQEDNMIVTVVEVFTGMMLDQVNNYMDSMAISLIKQFLATSAFC